MWFFLALLACGAARPTPDLWVDVEMRDSSSRVRVHLPANGLLTRKDTLEIETTDGTIDLTATARDFRDRSGLQSKTWTTADNDVKVTLSEHRPTGGAPATRLKIGARESGGFALELAVPLDRDGDGRCGEKIGDYIDFEDVDLELGPEFCRQLAQHGPTTIMSVEGGFLDGATLRTE